MSALLAASIGNTRVALGVFEVPAGPGAPEPVLADAFTSPDAETFTPPFQPEQPIEAAVFGSVNPRCNAAVTEWIAERFGVKSLCFPRDVPFPMESRCEPPDAVGADRLANALAAYHEFHANCLVVDAGTAITVDAVSAEGPRFLGGAILPGVALSAWSLARGTALLPEANVKDLGPVIGTSTSAAISSGALRGLAGAIDRLTTDLAQELGHCEHIVLTGGDAARLAGLCKTRTVARPHLTLAGLAIAYSLHSRR